VTNAVATVAAATSWGRRRRAMRNVAREFWRSNPGRIGFVVLLAFVIMALLAPLITSSTGLDTAAARANACRSGPRHRSTRRSAPTTCAVPSGAVRVGEPDQPVRRAGRHGAHDRARIDRRILAGFLGGRWDGVLMRLTEWFLVIPFLPLAIVLASVLGRSVWNIIFVIGVTSWPSTARLVAPRCSRSRNDLFVDRSRSLGGSGFHVVSRTSSRTSVG